MLVQVYAYEGVSFFKQVVYSGDIYPLIRFVCLPFIAIAFALLRPVVQILLTAAGYNFRTATRACANATFEGLCARTAE
jgi:hypothetical protein